MSFSLVPELEDVLTPVLAKVLFSWLAQKGVRCIVIFGVLLPCQLKGLGTVAESLFPSVPINDCLVLIEAKLVLDATFNK
jgi:hypothetical protein